MTRTPLTAVIALGAALLLAGCSGGTTAPALDAEAATGQTISGTGYSYTVPEGWSVPADSGATAQADTFAVDQNTSGDFADNVNVVISPAGEVSNDDVESAGVDELTGGGAEDVEALDRVTVASGEAAHLTGQFSSQGLTYTIDQYYLSHDGQTYVVTFSVNEGTSQADRDALAGSVLTTWEWA